MYFILLTIAFQKGFSSGNVDPDWILNRRAALAVLDADLKFVSKADISHFSTTRPKEQKRVH